MYQVMAGPDDGDVMSAPVPRDTVPERPLRVGYMEEHPSAPVTPETRAGVRTAAQRLRQQGHDVFPFTLSRLEEVREVWWTFFVRCGERLLRDMYKGREGEMSWVLRDFLSIAERGGALTSDGLLYDWLRRDQLRTLMMGEMREVDVLLTPVCSVPAFRHRERRWMVEGRNVEYLDAMSYTQWFNVLGNPAVVVPIGESPEGLPIGVQVVAKPWQESVAFHAAEVIEMRDRA